MSRLVIKQRDRVGATSLTGLVLTRLDAHGVTSRVLDHRAEWFDVVRDGFRESLSLYDARDRDALWQRVLSAHDAWTRRQGGEGGTAR